MTKEELEKEAIKYDADHLRGARGARWYHNVTIREAYLAGAEIDPPIAWCEIPKYTEEAE